MNEKQTVLIVEDEPQMVGVISYAFQVAGYETQIAYNARQASDHLRNYPIDLVVLDVMLPGSSGLDLCRQIRRDTTIPVLMLTAKSDQADVIKGWSMGQMTIWRSRLARASCCCERRQFCDERLMRPK